MWCYFNIGFYEEYSFLCNCIAFELRHSITFFVIFT